MLVAVLPRRVPKTLLRYEDLVSRGSPELAAHLDRIGVPDMAVPEFGPGDTLALGLGHGISGNPMRFERSQVTIRRDDAWRREMPRQDRVLTTAVTAPALLRYGYLGK
jgi:hypothetical protein